MIPPVRSARLTTKGNKGIRYGRVEVVAKLPKGDWIWPAIWMMPEESVYGEWPRSGEIDIMESRGNGRDYDEGGRNLYYGTVHWGKYNNITALIARLIDLLQAQLLVPMPIIAQLAPRRSAVATTLTAFTPSASNGLRIIFIST